MDPVPGVIRSTPDGEGGEIRFCLESISPAGGGGTGWSLRGWCFRDGRGGPTGGLRFRWAGGKISARRKQPRLHLADLWPGVEEAPFSGFQIAIELPPGRHRGVLECRVSGGRWVPLAELTLGATGWERLLGRARSALGRGRAGGARGGDGTAPTGDYAEWVRRHDTLDAAARARAEAHARTLEGGPLISVLMPTYNTAGALLRRAIESVQAQIYPRWELCVADDASPDPEVARIVGEYAARDPRVRLEVRAENGHISRASNSALAMARGEYVALLDHDDEIPPHALLVVADAVARRPEIDLLYSDEDKIDMEGRRHAPFFKPDWDPELLLAQNFFSHLGVYRASLVREAGGFRAGYEGSQDWDLALRCSERVEPGRVAHLPHILYHWRVVPGSTALHIGEKPYASGSGLRAVADHLERVGARGARVEPAPCGFQRVTRPLPEPAPAVALIIPTRDRCDLLADCLGSLWRWTDYPAWEVVVVDNDSRDRATLDLLAGEEAAGRIRVLRHAGPFNYPALNNRAVAEVTAEIVVLLNNDVRAIDPGWLRELVSQAARPDVGAVGARLLYPNGLLQHAGLVLGFEGVAGHLFRGLHDAPEHFAARAHHTQRVSAVTAACLAVSRAKYLEVGGMDEAGLAVAYNDVDLCLKLGRRGYRNLYHPHACLTHLEQASRGARAGLAEEKARRKEEMVTFRRRWGGMLDGDPSYNPNLTLENEDGGLAFPPRRAVPWGE